MSEELPAFNFQDDDQFRRLATHLLTLYKRAKADAALGKRTGHVYRIEITKVRKLRSGKQNAYYWAVVLPMSAKGFRDAWEEQVNSLDAHDFFKDRFLRVPVVNKRDGSGEVMGYRTRSTTDLTTVEFMGYVDEIVRFAAEYLQIEIPPPDPEWWRVDEDEAPAELPAARRQLPAAQRRMT